jgi:hypothetical protein
MLFMCIAPVSIIISFIGVTRKEVSNMLTEHPWTTIEAREVLILQDADLIDDESGNGETWVRDLATNQEAYAMINSNLFQQKESVFREGSCIRALVLWQEGIKVFYILQVLSQG